MSFYTVTSGALKGARISINSIGLICTPHTDGTCHIFRIKNLDWLNTISLSFDTLEEAQVEHSKLIDFIAEVV